MTNIIVSDPYNELPKARLCSSVVWAWLHGDESEIEESIAMLQGGLGSSWSLTAALQFMSGKRAKAALSCATAEEQESMLIAHQIAREFCSRFGLGAVNSLSDVEWAELRTLIASKQSTLTNKD